MSYIIELNDEQAMTLRALCGKVSGSPKNTWRKHTQEIFHSLPVPFHSDALFDFYDTVLADLDTIQANALPELKPNCHFTKQDVIDGVRNAVADYGTTWVDPNSAPGRSCKNVYTDTDGETRHCIIGHIVAKQRGIDIDTNASVSELAQSDNVSFDDDALELATVIQNMQDRGTPWGAISDLIDSSLVTKD